MNPGTKLLSGGISVFSLVCFLYYLRARSFQIDVGKKARMTGLAAIAFLYVLISAYYLMRWLLGLNLPFELTEQSLAIGVLILQLLVLLPLLIWQGFYRNQFMVLLLMSGEIVTMWLVRVLQENTPFGLSLYE